MKNISKDRIRLFKEEYCCAFEGTLDNPYDLSSTKKKRPTKDDIIKAIPTLEEFLKTQKSPVCYKEFYIVRYTNIVKEVMAVDGVQTLSLYDSYLDSEYLYSEYLLVIHKKSKFAYNCDDLLGGHSLSGCNKKYLLNKKTFDYSPEKDGKPIDAFNDDYSFISINSFRRHQIPNGIVRGNTFIINGDTNGSANSLVSINYFNKFPCLSFSCLANLIKNRIISSEDFIKTSRKQAEVIANSVFSVIDSEFSEYRSVSKEIKNDFHKQKRNNDFIFENWAANQKPIDPGFSIIDNGELKNALKWHRPPTVLVEYSYKTFLLGQDEGSYFGCVLSDNPKTIKEALISLIPIEARGVKGVIRQGEWFAIPVNKKNERIVPPKTSPNVVLFAEDAGANFSLPIENENSNKHMISGNLVFTNTGKLYARNFQLFHDQHKTMKGSTDVWYTFAKNTAIASFSQEGVD